MGSTTFTALITKPVIYPLDLAHGRMEVDMSKNVSIVATLRMHPYSTTKDHIILR
jgi:hypothetical protein